MSIHTALLAGTSGLRANASALAATSDNIANSNTVGFKRLRNDFTALLVGQNAYTSYNAGGVIANQTQEVGEQGALGTSQVSTHLAISGDGLFVTRPKANDATAADPYLFTRAGQFAPDADGYLQNTAGYYLYGWPVANDGSVAGGPSDLSALEPIQITGISGAADATENISFAANLDAAQTVSAAAATYDLTANPNLSMASGDFTPDFETTVQIYDSLGGIKTVALSFMKSPTANQWFTEVHMVPASDMQATGLPDGLLASGIVAFTPSGQLDLANTTLPSTLNIGGSATTATAPAVGWAAGSGLDAQTLNLDFAGAISTGGLTQYDSPSELNQSVVDGLAYGVLSTVEVDDEGYVNALFTNGMSRRIYQVPLATFSNYSGLRSEEGGAFSSSPDAGAVILAAAGESGAGSIQAKALENSTVDLAEEFTNLITTQRAYSASSKIITTADEMLDELIRLKR
jgi:flagellar hook protein FlgE